MSKEYIQQLIKNFLEQTTNPGSLSSRTLFVKEHINLIKELTSFFDENVKITERLYYIYYNLTNEDLKCPICGEKKRFYTFTKGYWQTCSHSCATKYQQKYCVNRGEVTRKCLETMKSKSDEEKDAMIKKRIYTTKKKYGDNIFSEISKKAYKTQLENGSFKSWFTIIRENNPELWKEMHKKAATTLMNDIDENGNNHYDRVHLKKLNDIDENGNNHYDRVHLKKLNDIDENGNNHYDRVKLNNYKNGVWTDPSDMDDFQLYSYLCRKITYKQDLSVLKNIEKRGNANKGLYHLDHKFSIFEGFKNNIPPYIIGNIVNLEMIIGRNNLIKNRKSSIKKEELFKKYFEQI